MSGARKGGFAGMPRDRVRELGRRGGVAVHRAGTGHEFTKDEARVAGTKGGYASAMVRAVARELGRWATDRRPLWVRALETRRTG